jgi:hypothetical protein
LGESPCGFESRPRHRCLREPPALHRLPLPTHPFPMISKTIHRRLTVISQELDALRDEGAILAEQLAFAHEVVEESRLRALVAETPLAERDLRIAGEDLRRIERVKADVERQAAGLRQEQDRLLAQAVEWS